MPSKHAMLSASGSHRWLACPPSALLESKFPDKGSEYATEGTYAHAVAELLTRNIFGKIDPVAYEKQMEPLLKDKYYGNDLLGYVGIYTDMLREKMSEARKKDKDAQLYVEQHLDFSPWVPDGYGTGDCVIIADGQLEIVDLKYGKGVPVSAHSNSQMRLYALGAVNEFDFLFDLDHITMTICQPRIDNIDSETLSLDELKAWGEQVKPVAALAAEGKGDIKPGDHCLFCKVAPRCRALAEYNEAAIINQFEQPALLSDEEVADIVLRESSIKKWLEQVSHTALMDAIDKGRKFPGLKLVEGRSNRVITNPNSLAAEILLKRYAQRSEIFKPEELRGITELTKIVGAKNMQDPKLQQYFEKPAGKPTLVPLTDKRPEWQGRDDLVDQFDNEET